MISIKLQPRDKYDIKNIGDKKICFIHTIIALTITLNKNTTVFFNIEISIENKNFKKRIILISSFFGFFKGSDLAKELMNWLFSNRAGIYKD